MKVKDINSKIRKVLKSNEALLLLDKLSHPYSDLTWTEGGCLILTETLLKMIPGSSGLMVWNELYSNPDHCLVKVSDNWVLDGNGLYPYHLFLNFWKKDKHNNSKNTFLSFGPLNIKDCIEYDFVRLGKNDKTLENFLISKGLEFLKDLPKLSTVLHQ